MTQSIRLTSRAALLAAAATTIVERDLDGLGTVRIKQLSIAEYDDVRARIKTDAPASEFGLALTAYALVDDDGAALFDAADLQPLRNAAGSRIDPLIGAVLEVQGFKKPDVPN